jgi:hypothetical protein
VRNLLKERIPMSGRYGEPGTSPAPVAVSHEELHRHMERGRDLRAAAAAKALARGGRLVQKLFVGRIGGEGAPGGPDRRRCAGPCHG